MILSGRFVACRQTPIRSFNCLFLPIGIKAEDLHFAAGARPQALKDFDRGRLTRAIRPEQTEDLAGAHLEIDALHRLD